MGMLPTRKHPSAPGNPWREDSRQRETPERSRTTPLDNNFPAGTGLWLWDVVLASLSRVLKNSQEIQG